MGEITHVYTKTIGSLEDDDWRGHERFASEAVMLATYRGYYGDRVDLDTLVKIIQFTFIPNV